MLTDIPSSMNRTDPLNEGLNPHVFLLLSSLRMVLSDLAQERLHICVVPAMNRAQAIVASLRLRFIEWRLASRVSTTRPLSFQVTQFSNCNSPLNFHFPNIHQRLCFSSKPDSIVELVLANDSSEGLEHELEKSYPSLSHETILYVLKKLDMSPQKASSFFNWVSQKDGFIPSSSLYSLMLKILANKEAVKQFWIILKLMKEKGFYIDEPMYLTILSRFKKEKMNNDSVALTQFHYQMLRENPIESAVKKVVDIILRSDWSDEIENDLGELKTPISDNFVIRVLKELRNFPLKTFNFFCWIGMHPDYEHNTVTYNAVARVLARDDSIEKFWIVIEEMKSVGHELDIDTYVKISRQFQKSKMIEDAVKLYELMMDGPYKPSEVDCAVLLRSISASATPNLDFVFRVAKKYESTGHTLSKAIYDGMHRSLTRAGKFDEAEKIVKTMRNAGYEPDNITNSQLVFGLCNAGRLEEACKVLDEMESSGCKPDVKTWTILIQGHCAANEVDKALLCFAKMIENGCNADADLLDVLVEGFLHQNKIDGAYELLVEMASKWRISPWQATFKKLIEKLLGFRKFEEALDLLHLMKKHNYPPFPEPFMQYISKFGTVEDAAEFLKALTVKDYPSYSAYLHIFESFFHEGRHSEAKDLLYKCPHHIRKHSKISLLFGNG